MVYGMYDTFNHYITDIMDFVKMDILSMRGDRNRPNSRQILQGGYCLLITERGVRNEANREGGKGWGT